MNNEEMPELCPSPETEVLIENTKASAVQAHLLRQVDVGRQEIRFVATCQARGAKRAEEFLDAFKGHIVVDAVEFNKINAKLDHTAAVVSLWQNRVTSWKVIAVAIFASILIPLAVGLAIEVIKDKLNGPRAKTEERK